MLLTFTGNNPSNPANNNRMDGYAYDAAGNLLNDGTNFYTYDAENRIIEVQQGSASGAVLATYEYDADGQRVHRTGVTTDTCDSAGVRDYIYDLAGHWILEVNNGGTYCKGEIYAAGRHLVSDADGNSIFDHSDWLGTARLRNSYANPTLFETCTSLPFGDALTCTGGDQSTIHFTGKERDAESGLDNFGFRFYSSLVGRFVKPDDPFAGWDESAPQTFNLYGYVLDDPTNMTDYDGHDPNSPIPAATCGWLCGLLRWLLGGGGHEEVTVHIPSPDPDITPPGINQILNQRVPGSNNLTLFDLNREGNKTMAEGIKVNSEIILQFGMAFIFPEGEIEDVVFSSARMDSPQITAGARAIAKKLGHALAEGVKSAFDGIPADQENAAALIHDIMTNHVRIDRLGKYTDVYNTAGQGIRIENGTNKFVGFLEGAKAKP